MLILLTDEDEEEDLLSERFARFRFVTSVSKKWVDILTRNMKTIYLLRLRLTKLEELSEESSWELLWILGGAEHDPDNLNNRGTSREKILW